MRRTSVSVAAVLALAVALVPVVSRVGTASAVAADPQAWTAVGGGPTHDGHATTTLSTALARQWSITLPATQVSEPVMSDGRTFVWSARALWALDDHDGHVLWQQDDSAGFRGLTVDGDHLVSVDAVGTVEAWSVRDGALVWATRITDQGQVTAAPTAAAGIVYATAFGAGGDLYAFDGATGRLLWERAVATGDRSAPTVAGGVVTTDGACDVVDAFDATTGASRWHHDEGCTGSGGATAPAHDGRVWLPGGSGAVLDGSTGTQLGTAPAGTITFDASRAFRSSGAAVAVDEGAPATPLWTSVASDYVTRGLTVSGRLAAWSPAGRRLDLLDEGTGAVTWSSGAVPGVGVGDLFGGLAAGDGLLALSVGPRVSGFASAAPAAAAPPTSAPVAPGGLALPPRGSSWTGIGGDGHHDGLGADGLPSTLVRRWSVALGAAAAQPLVLPGAVIYTSAHGGGGDLDVRALDPLTGAELWPTAVTVPGSVGRGLVAAGDGVVVVAPVGYGTVEGIRITDGVVLWSRAAGAESEVPQVDADGHAYFGQLVLDVATGQQVGGGAESGPATVVDGHAAFSTTRAVLAVREDEGRQTWSTGRPCCGGLTPALLGGLFDVRDDQHGSVTVAPVTGAVVDQLPSDVLPAGDGATAFLVVGSQVVAEDVATRLVRWRQTLTSPPAAQPVVSSGRILITDRSARLVVLDEATGSVLGATALLGQAVVGDSADGVLAGAAVGQGDVVVPTSSGLEVFASEGTTSPGAPDEPVPATPFTPAPPVSPGPSPSPSPSPSTSPSSPPDGGSGTSGVPIPGHVTGLTVEARSHALAVTWHSPASGAESYAVTLRPAGRTVLTAGTSAVITGLPDGVVQTVEVVAFGSQGAGSAVHLNGRPGSAWRLPYVKVTRTGHRVTVIATLPRGSTQVDVLQQQVRGQWQTLGTLRHGRLTVTSPRPLRLLARADATHVATSRRLR